MRYLLLISLQLSALLHAQNFVQNPSFEDIRPDAVVVPCEFTQYSYDFPRRAAVWTGFSNGTPDLLRSAENCDWLTQVHSGEQCLGIITYLPGSDVGQKSDFHEFVQGKLSAPLKPGKKYRFECWVKADSAVLKAHLLKVYGPKTRVAPVSSGNLGLCFSVLPFGTNDISSQIVAANRIRPHINYSELIRTDAQWTKISLSFTPDQPFQFFTLGNFFLDANTPNNLSPQQNKSIETYNGKQSEALDRIKRASYLCIDDVSISPEEPDLPPPSLEQALLKDRKFTFSAGVLFDSGSDQLRPEAGPSLDSLYAFLLKYPQIVIGISGHTDNVGSDEYNLDLSQRRASSVQGYLENKGVPQNRLRSRGFGETRPIGDNNTESGRQTNRRVECIVIKQ